ncbi:unnamed protein product [Penicillium viridicatum]
MDTAKDQNERGNPQPSQTPVESDRAASDLELPQQQAGLASELTTERFQPILEKLAHFERDDSKLAFQAARAIGLYRYTSASCVSMSPDKEKLDPYGQGSRGAGVNLHDTKDGLQPCTDKQLSPFYRFERGLKLSRERLMGALEDWNQRSKGDLASMADARKELPVEECDTSVS